MDWKGKRPRASADLVRALGNWSEEGQGPTYARLAAGLAAAIRRGEVGPGERLPAERVLARLLAVSRTTIVGAYERLRQEEWIESRQGSGTRVRSGGSVASGGEAPPAAGAGSFRRHPVYRSLIEGSAGTIEFLGAHLSGAEFLVPELARIDRPALTELARTPGYLPMGLPALRRAIAAHLARCGLPTSEEQVLVTNGAQQAVALAGALLLRRGDAVALENPTYLGAIDIFTNLGARLIPAGVGREGVRVETLRELAGRAAPRLIYLMPTFQNPTGALMPERQRRAVARLGRELKVPLIEDNTLADLWIDAPPPPPLAAFEPEAVILTIGSLSKLFWGGLRVGWIRASEEILSRLAKLKIMADLGGSLLSQLAAVRLLVKTERFRQMRRREVRERLGCLTALLERHLPEWTWTPPAGGLSLWVQLPRGDAGEFAQVALRHGVSVVPGPLTSPDGSFPDHLRLPFVLGKAEMREGIERLARAWNFYAAKASRKRTSLDVLV
ncbi:MAG TPA: PLP-dependent aminotransferase family protein [Thermoanaerobaculia bacterium]|nr:PLP-dependent aminotransferase family protein [Thermoanaerobaculia bacterium]